MNVKSLQLAIMSLAAMQVSANDLRTEILTLIGEKDYDSAIVALALADVLGMIAAKQDQLGSQFTLQDRLHEICHRVEETYERFRDQTC